jgi:thiol-disulfide isomerase/thioredoxin
MKMRMFHVAVILAIAAAAVAFLRPADPFEQVLSDWRAAENAYWAAVDRAKTAVERRNVEAELRPRPEPYAARLVDLVEARPKHRHELSALCWAVATAPDSSAGRRALAMLKDDRIARADPRALGNALDWTEGTLRPKGPSPLAPLVLERARRCFDDPRAARLLTWVCANEYLSDRPQESPEFSEAADLLVEHFTDSPDISNFCETLGSVDGGPSWAVKYENHLLRILEENHTRLVRCTASYALASIVQSGGELRQREAMQLYEQFIRDFDPADSQAVRIEESYVASARSQLAALRSTGLGRPAPEIVGQDLDGRPMTLSEYRGRVVLVSFWATWCEPCMRLIPHEQALASRLKGKPFAIVGVNGDVETDELAKAREKFEMPWRSFQNRRADANSISEAWSVSAWPTLYLIDRQGVVRKRWLGAPPPEELDREVDLLLATAVAVK